MQYLTNSNLTNVHQVVSLTNKKFTGKILTFAMPASGKIVDHEPSGDLTGFEICQNGIKVSWETPVNVNLNSNINIDTQYLDSGYQSLLANIQDICNDIENNEITILNLKPAGVFHFRRVNIINPGGYTSSDHVQATTMRCNGDATQSFTLSNIGAIINAINSLVGSKKVDYQSFVRDFQQQLTANRYLLRFQGNKDYDMKRGILLPR